MRLIDQARRRARHFVWMALALAGSVVTQASQSSMRDVIKKAESGDQAAQFQLGRAYQEGSGIEQDDELAARWYRKAAEQGHSKAQNSLGLMYRQGKGMPRDKEEAARWYTKAALQCDPNGAYNLAIAYYNGDGLNADIGLAFGWLLVARQCGNTEIKSALDQISAEMKIRQRQNAETKFIWYMLATQDFRPDVDQILATMETIDPPIAYEICSAYAGRKTKRRDTTKAQSWCEKALSLNLPDAYLVLGALAEERNDFSAAAELYKKAVNARVLSAIGILGMLYLEGKGVQQDPVQAYFWLYLAHEKLGRLSYKSGFDRASLQLPEEEKKNQEKKAKDWFEKQWH